MGDGSWVALDVHARSVAACVLDGVTGELRSRRVPPESERIVEWLATLAGPVRVAYERVKGASARISAPTRAWWELDRMR